MAKTKKQKNANFGIRLVASLVDGIIFSAVWGVVGQMKALPFGQPLFKNFGFLACALYSILLWVNWNGQTIGKKVMKIKVIQKDGKVPDYKVAVIRYIGYIISAIPFLLGYFWVVWDEEKQAWHDKIAGTYVVEE